MKLKLLDRILLANVLPREGNIRSLTIVSDIQEKIKLKQKEFEEFNIEVQQKGNITWNEKGAEATFDIAFTELEQSEIKLCLQKADREKKINIDMLGLVKLFNILTVE